MPAPLRRLGGILLMIVALVLALVVGPSTAQAAVPGTVAGHLAENGVPVEGATVVLLLMPFQAPIAQGLTNDKGGFGVTVPAGEYKVRFDLPGGLTQFYQQKTDISSATVLSVGAGQEVSIEESVVPHGSLGGQITTSGGKPAPGALVGLARTNSFEFATQVTDSDGRYLFPFVPAGTFQVSVSAAKTSAPKQWAKQRRSRTQADPFPVTVGELTTVDEQLLPLGTIAGRFTNSGGPVPGVGISALSQTSAAESVFASTGPDGNYSMLAYPGTYKVRYLVPDSLEQWASGKEFEWQADVVTVVADTTLTLNQTALPTGRILGHLTDSNGEPAAQAGVLVLDPSTDRYYRATTFDDGSWFLTVRPGTYKVEYDTTYQVQFAQGKTSLDTATPVTVLSGQSTVIDDQLLVPGTLAVSATDAGTGEALLSFCATASNDFAFQEQCTEDGTAEFAAIGAGTYDLKVSDGVRLDRTTAGVVVRSGQSTVAKSRLKMGGTITVTVIDAVTGEPVSGVCVNGQLAERATGFGEFIGECADADGKLTMSRIPLDKYVLFANVFDGVHGSQWIGSHGGVGSQAAAKVVTSRSGVTTDLTVRLDGAGSITGAVTDKATGQPIENAVVSAWGAAASTDASGHYSLDGLGPYQWTLFFSQDNYAGQWSGGGNNRLTATPIRVRVGQTTQYSTSLRRGTTVTGKVSGLAGQPPDWAEVTIVNASTFNELAHVIPGADGTYTAHILGPVDVKLLLIGAFNGSPVIEWWKHSADFARGRTIFIPSSGVKMIDLPAG